MTGAAPGEDGRARRPTRWFRLEERGVIEVGGLDRLRWLNGMVSNVVPAEDACVHAAILTPKGGVVADLFIVHTASGLWLELEREAVGSVCEHLERLVIADDVTLSDRSETLARIAVEGPAAAEVLVGALGARSEAPPGKALSLSAAARSDAEPAVTAALYSLTGSIGVQLFVPPASLEGLERALEASGVARGDAAEFETLRIEAGVPRVGRELVDVLPDEARLEDAISTTKGCYAGQEIVARLRSRGQVRHRLVGLRIPAANIAIQDSLPGAALEIDGKRTGEVTSAVLSPAEGPIALGFVRSEHAQPGQALEVVGAGGRLAATVAALPFPSAELAPGPKPGS